MHMSTYINSTLASNGKKEGEREREAGESSELRADTREEDALGDTVKNKSKCW